MPCLVASGTSMESKPTPQRDMTLRFFAAGERRVSALYWSGLQRVASMPSSLGRRGAASRRSTFASSTARWICWAAQSCLGSGMSGQSSPHDGRKTANMTAPNDVTRDEAVEPEEQVEGIEAPEPGGWGACSGRRGCT